MEPKILKTEEEYEAALVQLHKHMHAEPGTPKAERFEFWAKLVEEYESLHFPIEAPDPIEAILFRMEQADLTQRDLEPYLGSGSIVSEVLSRKRGLTDSMIQKLHKGLGIPLECLLVKQLEPA